MSDQTFDFVVTGVSSGTQIHLVSQQLAKALKQDPQYLELRLSEFAMSSDGSSGSDFPIIRNTSQANVDKLQAFLSKHGIQGEARQTLAIEEMIEKIEYTCPACGHRQDDDGSDICQKCGVVGSRYDSFKRKKDIYDSEKRYMQADAKFSREQSQKEREKAEEEALREEARRQLGLKSKKGNNIKALLSFLLVASISAGGYWFWSQQQPASEAVLAENAEGTEEEGGAGIAIKPQGGNLTLQMPPAAVQDSSSSAAAMPSSGNPYTDALGAQGSGNIQIVTEQNMPSMSDAEAQNLALSMYQQAEDVAEPLQDEAIAKASIMAMSIDNPAQRQAVMQLTGQQPWQPEMGSADDSEAGLFDEKADNPQLASMQQAIEQQLPTAEALDAMLMKLPSSSDQARLLLKAMDQQWKMSKNKTALTSYIEKMAKLTWSEQDAAKQVLIQGTLSQAYQGMDDKKLANVNLIMAVQSLNFVNGADKQVDLLCELADYQRQVKAYDVAWELFQLAEQKAEKLSSDQQAKHYAAISKGYASIYDFTTAVKLFDRIDQPNLLQESMQVVENMQQQI